MQVVGVVAKGVEVVVDKEAAPVPAMVKATVEVPEEPMVGVTEEEVVVAGAVVRAVAKGPAMDPVVATAPVLERVVPTVGATEEVEAAAAEVGLVVEMGVGAAQDTGPAAGQAMALAEPEDMVVAVGVEVAAAKVVAVGVETGAAQDMGLVPVTDLVVGMEAMAAEVVEAVAVAEVVAVGVDRAPDMGPATGVEAVAVVAEDTTDHLHSRCSSITPSIGYLHHNNTHIYMLRCSDTFKSPVGK